MSKPRRLNTRKLLTATAGLATVSYMGTTGCDARPADFELGSSSTSSTEETGGDSAGSSTSGGMTTGASTSGSSTTGATTSSTTGDYYYGSGNLMAPYCEPPAVGGAGGEGGAGSEEDANWPYDCY